MTNYKIRGADQKEYGPVSEETLRQWITEGRVTGNMSILAEGSTEWKPLSTFPEFSSAVSAGLAAPGTLAQAAPGAPGIPASKPVGALPVVSLVCGILSVTCLGLLAGLPAIITGHLAFGRARKAPSQHGGGGMALAGLIMGYISIILTLVVLGVLLPAVSKLNRMGGPKENTQRIICVNNLKQVALGARIWSTDHGDKLPPDFLTMSNELNTPKILVCPADGNHSLAATWKDFDAKRNVTYEYLLPGIEENKAAREVVFRCPIHNTVAYGDGSVEQRSTRGRASRR
jgi:hypothetical protein